MHTGSAVRITKTNN